MEYKTAKQLAAIHRKMKNPPACEKGHLSCSCTSEEGGVCFVEVSNQIKYDTLRAYKEGR